MYNVHLEYIYLSISSGSSNLSAHYLRQVAMVIYWSCLLADEMDPIGLTVSLYLYWDW